MGRFRIDENECCVQAAAAGLCQVSQPAPHTRPAEEAARRRLSCGRNHSFLCLLLLYRLSNVGSFDFLFFTPGPPSQGGGGEGVRWGLSVLTCRRWSWQIGKYSIKMLTSVGFTLQRAVLWIRIRSFLPDQKFSSPVPVPDPILAMVSSVLVGGGSIDLRIHTPKKLWSLNDNFYWPMMNSEIMCWIKMYNSC